MSKKQRLDIILVEQGLCESREQAKRLIMAGEVMVDSLILDKPGKTVDPGSSIEIKDRPPYVSRGGLKLQKALIEFNINVTGKICADIGASTGGFSDCLLQHHARRIYAIDVGSGQIHEYLRRNPNCIIIENLNARYLKSDSIPEKVDLAVMDVAFISVTKILGSLKSILFKSAEVVILVKPQFEAERGSAKHGVVRDCRVHDKVLHDVIDAARNEGYCPVGLTYSPIQGAKGNIEYLLYLLIGKKVDTSLNVGEIIRNAHMELET